MTADRDKEKQMTTPGKTFRIFVSSTFQDLKAERDALQRVVFPRLRKLCEQYGARFQAIDLRWGVSEEASLDQQAMNICLGEIERCQRVTPRPNFIVLLGDRYGWCPPPSQITEAEFRSILSQVDDPDDRALILEQYALDRNAVPPEYYLLPRTGKMAQYDHWAPVEERLQRALAKGADRIGLTPKVLAKYSTSATEQEIIKGTTDGGDARDHVFAFLRSIEGLPDDLSAGEYVDLDQSGKRDTLAAGQVRDLKRRLSDSLAGNVHQYSPRWTGNGITLDHLDQLCDDVYECLARVVLAEIERPSIQPLSTHESAYLTRHQALDDEGLAHHAFAEERLEIFVGRTDNLKAIKDYIDGDEQSVLGVSGFRRNGKVIPDGQSH